MGPKTAEASKHHHHLVVSASISRAPILPKVPIRDRCRVDNKREVLIVVRIRYLGVDWLVDAGSVAVDAFEPHGADRGHFHVDFADENAVVDQTAVHGAEGGLVLLRVAAVEDEAGVGEGEEGEEDEGEDWEDAEMHCGWKMSVSQCLCMLLDGFPKINA